MPTLLLATIILWVVGIILLVVARILKPPPTTDAGTEPPSWEWILRSIFGGVIAAITKITNPSGTWELIEGVGDLLMWLGALSLVGYVLVDVVKLIPGTATPSPSPSAS